MYKDKLEEVHAAFAADLAQLDKLVSQFDNFDPTPMQELLAIGEEIKACIQEPASVSEDEFHEAAATLELAHNVTKSLLVLVTARLLAEKFEILRN